MDQSKITPDRDVVVFDIETDGLLDEGTVIHCAVARKGSEELLFGPDQIQDFIRWLGSQETVVAHNALGFDIPMIQKLYPHFVPPPKVYDTLVMSRLLYPDMKKADFKRRNKPPGPLLGRHSLESWGYRLGALKGDFIAHGDFSQFSPEMLEYCRRDVEILVLLWNHLIQRLGRAPDAIEIEHQFSLVIPKITQTGVRVFMDGLKIEAQKAKNKLAELKPKFTSLGIANPLSRVQLAKYLIDRGWEPKDYTKSGRPKINDLPVVEEKFPDMKGIDLLYKAQKAYGFIKNGDNSLLKWTVPGSDGYGRIYGKIIHNGTRTNRCAHFHPNLAQVPTKRTSEDLGINIRQHFLPDEGEKLIGCDAKSLEFRILAHYLIKVEPKARDYFTPIFLEGEDIHTKNQEAAGLETRDQAKVFLYALMYGAGIRKLAKIMGTSVKEASKIVDRFLDGIPGLRKLVQAVQAKARQRPVVFGLDGRPLWLDGIHSSLNTLIQGGGAIAMKVFTNEVAATGQRLVLHVHDEIQITSSQPESTLAILQDAAKRTTQALALNVPFEVDSRIGDNWDETH